MLEVIGLHSYHGGIHALQGVDFSIKAGEIVTLSEIQCAPVVINAYLGDEDEEPLRAHG